jgi:hypothetical protein
MGQANIKEVKAFKRTLGIFEAASEQVINPEKYIVLFIKPNARIHRRIINILGFKEGTFHQNI